MKLVIQLLLLVCVFAMSGCELPIPLVKTEVHEVASSLESNGNRINIFERDKISYFPVPFSPEGPGIDPFGDDRWTYFLGKSQDAPIAELSWLKIKCDYLHHWEK